MTLRASGALLVAAAATPGVSAAECGEVAMDFDGQPTVSGLKGSGAPLAPFG